MFLVALAWSAQISVAEKAVSDLEYQWAEAQRLGKADVVGPMLAETFTNTDVDGETYGKPRLRLNLKGGKWEVNGISDVEVKVYGDAAVATGSWKGKGVDGDGTRIDRHRALDRHLGENAERNMAVCRQPADHVKEVDVSLEELKETAIRGDPAASRPGQPGSRISFPW